MIIRPLPVNPPTEQATPRPRVGLVLLATDLTTERDFCRMQGELLPANLPGFDLFVNRIRFRNPITPDSLEAMLADLPRVVTDILPDQALDAVVYHCTSGSAHLGDEAIIRAVHSAQPDCRVITTARACVSHILGSGHRRISLLAPYVEDVSRLLARYFATNGLDVVSLNYLDIADDQAIGELQAGQIIDAAAASVDPEAEALFISCTATRAAEILPQIERAIGKPCFSSNYSTFSTIISTLYPETDQ